jgi:hypothetical protein
MTPNAACYGARRLIHLDPAEISIRSRDEIQSRSGMWFGSMSSPDLHLNRKSNAAAFSRRAISTGSAGRRVARCPQRCRIWPVPVFLPSANSAT